MNIELIIIILLLFIVVFLLSKNNQIKKTTIVRNETVSSYNEELENRNKKLLSDIATNQIKYDELAEIVGSRGEQASILAAEVNSLQSRKKEISEELQNETTNLNTLKQTIKDNLESQKKIADEAFNDYKNNLSVKYKEADEEFNELTKIMQNAYSNCQTELNNETKTIRAELENIRAARAATIEAAAREREIEENKDDFRLDLDGKSLGDIKILKSIQDQISNPIVIDKIIWSNYYQPIAKAKFPKIVGKAEACGIYKLTSLVTGETYIGQSRTIVDRWKDHCKNTLGVGTSTARNKLYSAMKRDGLENYTFEVLEECDVKYLDEKEKYYIALYNSYDFGLNATQGNN